MTFAFLCFCKGKSAKEIKQPLFIYLKDKTPFTFLCFFHYPTFAFAKEKQRRQWMRMAKVQKK
jgi:hypothetical protein